MYDLGVREGLALNMIYIIYVSQLLCKKNNLIIHTIIEKELMYFQKLLLIHSILTEFFCVCMYINR